MMMEVWLRGLKRHTARSATKETPVVGSSPSLITNCSMV